MSEQADREVLERIRDAEGYWSVGWPNQERCEDLAARGLLITAGRSQKHPRYFRISMVGHAAIEETGG